MNKPLFAFVAATNATSICLLADLGRSYLTTNYGLHPALCMLGIGFAVAATLLAYRLTES